MTTPMPGPARAPRSSRAAGRSPVSRTILFNKPYGVLCQFTDAGGRPTLADYIPVPGVYAAGRLDMDSEGLLLLTDDGVLIHHLADPQHKIPKTYLVQVERVPDSAALEQLRHGVTIEGELSRPVHVERLATPPDLWERAVPIRYRKSVPTAWLRIVLTEGRNRQVRRMTAAVGYPTLRLVRAAIGPFRLDDLKPGAWRELPNRSVRGAVARLESASGQGTNDR